MKSCLFSKKKKKKSCGFFVSIFSELTCSEMVIISFHYISQNGTFITCNFKKGFNASVDKIDKGGGFYVIK